MRCPIRKEYLGHWPSVSSIPRLLSSNSSGSYVHDGIRYEEHCVKSLQQFGMDTRRVGGPGDGGIDLSGFWRLGERSEDAIPIIVQCKYLRERDCPPSFLRELEGTLARRMDGTVGILVSSRPASQGTIEALRVAPTPLLYLLFDGKMFGCALASANLFKRIPGLVIASKHTTNGLVQPILYIS